MTAPDERAQRAARRAYVREHHPDIGGDAIQFAAGLARFDGASPNPAQAHVRVVRSRRPSRVLRRSIRQLRRRLAGLPPRNLR